MADNQEYTFEDWLNDSKEWYTQQVKLPGGETDRLEHMKTGYHPDILLKREKISEATFKKIREEQEKAYDIAVEYYINEALEELRRKVAQASDSSEYLAYRHRDLKQQLETANSKVLENVASGDKDLRTITSSMYKEIMNNKESPPKLLYIGGIYTGMERYDKPRKISPHFKYKILYEEYLAVKDMMRQHSQSSSDIDMLLDDFSTKFSENTQYDKDHIFRYLQLWNDLEGIPNRRARTKAKLEEQKLEVPYDGTLKNWEDKWTEFKEARTGK